MEPSVLSLIVGVALLVIKFWAFRMTGSQSIFSDAMESIVNVIAAGLAIFVLMVARKPADNDHPYGHGKIEYFSSAFEGGLITFASILITVEAVSSLISGRILHELGFGLAVTLGAGVCNALLGLYLIRKGREEKSAALEAGGQHVLSDFWTSVGVVVGLLLVKLTGLAWIDSATALIFAGLLGWTGLGLVRKSASHLMDEEDKGLIKRLLEIVERERPEGIIQIHHLRMIRSGRYHHIDAHAVVPQNWDVAEAHECTSNFEERILKSYDYKGELHLHVDPCRKAYCKVCEVPKCHIRVAAFEQRRKITLEELVHPEEPSSFR